MLFPKIIKPTPAAPRTDVTLSTQIASGLAAMLMTMVAISVTLPPRDVATAGRVLVASSGLHSCSTARA